MSLTRTVVISVSVLALCSSCAPEEGNGFLVTLERRVSQLFTKVQVEDGLSVEIVRGNQSVSITTDDNLIDQFVADVDGETLKLRRSKSGGISATFAHVQVSSDVLRKLEVRDGSQVVAVATQSEEWHLDISGGSTCQLTNVSADRFYLDISGASQAQVSGTATEVKIDAKGNSWANTNELIARNAKVQASGESTINVNASSEIEIQSSGNSEIFVSGNPSVRSVNADNGSRINFVPQ